MATTLAQAAEKVVVEAATDVATGILKGGTKDLKVIENSVAKEAVHATKDDSATFLSKIEGAAEIVANEVVKGAQDIVTAVEEHPELIAEGGLAIAVGAVSLVQPEFLAGEVAIIGKMAGDSARTTLTQIAQDEGTKVVQAISKDASADAKKVEEAAKKAEKEASDSKSVEKTTADGAVKVDDKIAADSSKAGLTTGEVKDLGAAIAAKVSPGQKGDEVVTLELDQSAPGKESPDATAHNPITLKITVGADGQVKGVAQTVVDKPETEEAPKSEETKGKEISESKIEDPKDVAASESKNEAEPKIEKTTAKEVKGVTPKAEQAKTEDKPKVEEKAVQIQDANGEKPVSLNVTIGADGHVESVKQTVLEPAPAPVDAPQHEEAKVGEVKESKIEESKPEESKAQMIETAKPLDHVFQNLQEPPAPETSKHVQIDSVNEIAAEPVITKEVPEETPTNKEKAPKHEAKSDHVIENSVHEESPAPAKPVPVVSGKHEDTKPVDEEIKQQAVAGSSEPVQEAKSLGDEVQLVAAASSLAVVGAVSETEGAKLVHSTETEAVVPTVDQHEGKRPAVDGSLAHVETEKAKEAPASAAKDSEPKASIAVEESAAELANPGDKVDEAPIIAKPEEQKASEETHVEVDKQAEAEEFVPGVKETASLTNDEVKVEELVNHTEALVVSGPSVTHKTALKDEIPLSKDETEKAAPVNGEPSGPSEPEQTPAITLSASTHIKASTVTQQQVEPASIPKESEPRVKTETASIEKPSDPFVAAADEHSKDVSSEHPGPSKDAEDVPLPFTVEHVAAPQNHSPKEPTKHAPELQPAPPTSTDMKASEIAAPAAIVAAATTTSVMKAISSAPEPTPAPLSPTVTITQESLDHLHSKLDTMHEAIQQLAKTISSQAAAPNSAPAVETKPVSEPVAANEIQPVAARSPEPIVSKIQPIVATSIEPVVLQESEPTAKSPEPATSKDVEPIATKSPESKVDIATPADIKVTVKSVEIVQPSNSAPESAEQPIAESSKAIATSKPVEAPAEAQNTTPVAAKRSSVWRYLWPFGGAAPAKAAEPSKAGTKTTETPEAPAAEIAAPSIPQMAA